MKDKLEEKYWRMVMDHCTNKEIWDFVETSGFPNGLHAKHLKSYLTSSKKEQDE